ncbi:MAG: hypothetical protein GWP06_03925 [Actinobacteria bacterium]|nr:hypothetical protein [Actinomycetota bacterium]
MSTLGYEEGVRRMVTALLRKIMEDQETITCRQLCEKELPGFVKNSFHAIARRRIKEKEPVVFNANAGSDFDDEIVKSAREQLMNELQSSVQFSRADAESCVKKALKIRFELLLRPQYAIETIFFRKTNELDKNLLKLSLKRFGENIPFLEHLCEELDKYENDRIDNSRFKLFAQQVMYKLYSNGYRQTILIDSNLLIDFFDIDGALEANGLESRLVEEFFSTRGFTDAFQTIHQKIKEGKRYWSKEDFMQFLPLVVNGGKNASTADAREELTNNNHPRIIYTEDSFEKIQRAKIERQPPGPYPSILEFIDPEDWKLLLKKIFKKDSLDFSRFIHKIDRVDKWRSSKEIIDWELEQRSVDPYSKEAVKLGDIVFAKFFSKGKYA